MSSAAAAVATVAVDTGLEYLAGDLFARALTAGFAGTAEVSAMEGDSGDHD